MPSFVDETSGELVEYTGPSVDRVREEISSLASGNAARVFSTIVSDDWASKMLIARAVNGSEPVDENLNKELKVTNFVVQAADMVDQQTKAPVTVPRVIILTEDGKAYHAMSGPLFRDVQNMIGILGNPSTWAGPVPIKVVKEGKAPNAYFTIKYV